MVRVRVGTGKIWSSVLDKLILVIHHTHECSYRIESRLYKSGVKGTLRYTFENDQHREMPFKAIKTG